MVATTCSSCGRTVVAGALYCVSCGSPIPTAPVTSSGEPTIEVAPERTVGIPVPPPDGYAAHPPEPLLAPSARWWLLVAALLAGVVLGGLLAAVRDTDDPPGEVLARADVGPQGGTLRFGDGSIEFPRNAVTRRTTITVRRVTSDRREVVHPPGADEPRTFPAGDLTLYSFEPHDLRFALPVRVTLPVGSSDPGVAFVREGERLLFVPGRADPGRRVVVVETLDLGFTQAQPLTEREP